MAVGSKEGGGGGGGGGDGWWGEGGGGGGGGGKGGGRGGVVPNFPVLGRLARYIQMGREGAQIVCAWFYRSSIIAFRYSTVGLVVHLLIFT